MGTRKYSKQPWNSSQVLLIFKDQQVKKFFLADEEQALFLIQCTSTVYYILYVSSDTL